MRIVTWNLWWRFGSWADRLDAIASVIDQSHADIICLQEVWATPSENQAAILAHRRGLEWTWVPSPAPERWQQRIADPFVDIGNAILSRFPIEMTRTLPLAADKDIDEGRHAVMARLSVHGSPLSVVTIQLASPPHLSAVRVAQVRQLATWIADIVPGDELLIVTGDFNALPESDEVRLFEGHLTAPVVPGRTLIDAWRYADPSDPGYTWSRRNPHVAATHEIDARIDYVFLTPPAPSGRGHVRSATLAGDRAVRGLWPSDHAAVQVDVAC